MCNNVIYMTSQNISSSCKKSFYLVYLVVSKDFRTSIWVGEASAGSSCVDKQVKQNHKMKIRGKKQPFYQQQLFLYQKPTPHNPMFQELKHTGYLAWPATQFLSFWLFLCLCVYWIDIYQSDNSRRSQLIQKTALI